MTSDGNLKYHVPVLLNEVIQGLQINEDGVYIDATFGAGGHSRAILDKLNVKGHLYGIDQDSDAIHNVISDDPKFSFVHGNFRYIKRFMRYAGVDKVDGVFADLGVSSHQFDTVGRGFSIRFEDELDMRMNQGAKYTAADILNSYSHDDLTSVFSQYGNVRNSKTLARNIVQRRRARPFKEAMDFIEFIDKIKMGTLQKYAATVFQALRIEVNDEYHSLIEFLTNSKGLLKEGGVLAVISYHSLEDKLVKNLIRSGSVDGSFEEDDRGRVVKEFEQLNKKVIVPKEDEVEVNSRARSAKLRLAKKL